VWSLSPSHMWGWHSICKIAQFELIDSGVSVFFTLQQLKYKLNYPFTFQYMKLNCPELVVVCFLLVLGSCYNNISRWYVAICSSANSLFQWASFVLLMALSKKCSSLWLIYSTGTLCNNILVFIALYWRSCCAISSLILEINYLQLFWLEDSSLGSWWAKSHIDCQCCRNKTKFSKVLKSQMWYTGIYYFPKRDQDVVTYM